MNFGVGLCRKLTLKNSKKTKNMSVKIIIHDAKRHIEATVTKYCEDLFRINTKINALRRTPRDASFNYMPIMEGQKLVDVIGELVRTMKGWLESPELFQNENDETTLFKMPANTAKSLFKREITGTVVLCRNAFFEVRGIYTEDEVRLLVLEKVRKLRSQVDYLKFRQESSDDNLEYERLPIPEEVRNEVWRRDQAKCTRCKSVFKLEFDHIIPVSRGGSNTARNIQLLCEICNRQKSDSIG
jgi:hypothetical protein